MFLIALALGGCALDAPETSSDELASTYNSYVGGIEAESGSVSGAIHRVTDVTSASAGAYLSFDGPGYVRYFVNTYETAPFTVWARVKSPTASSFSMQIDGVASHVDFGVMPSWTWVRVGGRSLSSGQHTLRFDVDAPGLLVDRLVFADDSTYTPVTALYEAESASLVYPMRAASQLSPTGFTAYAWSPTGTGNGGRLDLDIRLPYNADGNYRIWVRANAVSELHNQLAFSHDGQVGSLADVPLTSTTGYTWSTPAWLSFTSSDILSIGEHEDGVKIDKILLSNDIGFNLVESSPPLTSSL